MFNEMLLMLHPTFGVLAIIAGQCLDRRTPDQTTFAAETQAWQHRHKASHNKANWRFTTADARIKLRHLYPVF